MVFVHWQFRQDFVRVADIYARVIVRLVAVESACVFRDLEFLVLKAFLWFVVWVEILVCFVSYGNEIADLMAAHHSAFALHPKVAVMVHS